MIDWGELKERCKTPLKKFWKKYEEHVVTVGDQRYIYINRGAPVLAVAHLDTVIDPKKVFSFNKYRRGGITICKTPTLDDRLGVYIILDLLSKLLGEEWADILLTEGEEKGNSTARLFEKAWMSEDDSINRDINWICEFDRGGTSLSGKEDVVLYDFSDKATEKLLKENGYDGIGRGSYTDICYLHELGRKAFNFGVGYHNGHDTKAWACAEEIQYAVDKFVGLYGEISGQKLEHKKPPAPKYHQAPLTVYGPSRFWPGEMVKTYKLDSPSYMVVSGSPGRYVLKKSGTEEKYEATGAGFVRNNTLCATCMAPGPTIACPGENHSVNLCETCYERLVGEQCVCVSCGVMVRAEDLADKHALLCEYCYSESNSRIAIGEVVKFVSGSLVYEVVTITRSGNYILSGPGMLLTNGGKGYKKENITPVRDMDELNEAYKLFFSGDQNEPI